MSVRPISLLVGALGCATTAVTAGLLFAGELSGVEVLAGDVRVEGEGVAVLGPGAVIGVGTGTALTITGTYAGGDVDLGRGPVDGSHVFAHFGPVAGLYRSDGTPFGDDPRFAWIPKGGTLGVTCDRMVQASENQRIVGRASPEGACAPAPLWVRTGGGVRLHEIRRDGVPVVWQASAYDGKAAIIVAIVVAALSNLLRFEGLYPLLAMPLALLAPRVGLPAEAGAWLILATAGASAAIEHGAWRRWFGAALALAGIALAGLSVVRERAQSTGAAGAVSNFAAAVDIAFVQRKVDTVVARSRGPIAAASAPLIVALGSSSSGGGTQGKFWPDVLREELAGPTVISLAEGGATSWHMRRILEGLDVRPAACVLYLGQNDTTKALPGLTIAELERGAPAVPGVWLEPVTLVDAKEHITAIAARCGVTVAMPEYVLGREDTLAAYAEMLKSVGGVRFADPGVMLRAQPRALVMLDDVHPSPAGQDLLGKFVAAELKAAWGE